VRTTFTLGYELLGAHFGEYYVITILGDVRNPTFVVWEEDMKIFACHFKEKILCFSLQKRNAGNESVSKLNIRFVEK
jgi:hypothetical protein